MQTFNFKCVAKIEIRLHNKVSLKGPYMLNATLFRASTLTASNKF